MPALILRCLLLASLWAGTSGDLRAAPAGAYAFRNPYYAVTAWKLWFEDGTPQEGITLPSPRDIQYAHDPDPARAGLYLDYRRTRSARPYAGFRDDVYVSQDGNHTFIADSWTGLDGNAIAGIRASMVTGSLPGPVALTHGANFTSQSTTGMGHDITNGRLPVIWNERYYYFAGCLRAGPAHISFQDQLPERSTDEYQALVPSLYNSVGSSGSEVSALAKLVAASGYLPAEVKRNMKRAGIYPASLLYIWKAALPYAVPYADELRHRVAYYSLGDHSDYTGPNQTTHNHYYHQYDDNLHMANMVRIAKSMAYPPPVAILRKVAITGGTVVNDSAKTAWLVHQAAGEPVTLTVSPADSYDIYGLPLTYRMTLIHGDPKTEITRDPVTNDFRIFVPGTAGLPAGRTTVLLIANNGYFDSNPAAVNIYRTGGAPNRRPAVSWPRTATLLPGELFQATLAGKDPEGFPVRFSRWSGEAGVLDGNSYMWSIPTGHRDGDVKVHFIASDGTAGNSHQSAEVTIRVRSTIADIATAVAEDVDPLTVRFDPARSRDKAGHGLAHAWDFGDGNTSTVANPVHRYAEPGRYTVTHTVRGPSGSSQATAVVRPAGRSSG